mmetsp:Transcript_28164/g.94870  ORF Transcript_28164/g.94870 Transcript_28164/m.94870 type:complete len:231 (+) Transcript_28164:784-1476(+)
MAPASPGNCSAKRRIARAALRSQGDSFSAAVAFSACSGSLMCCAPEPRMIFDCSARRRSTKSSSCSDDLAASQLMKLSKICVRALCCAASSSGSAMKHASCASCETHAANSRCLRRCTVISERRRKPHMASKGVSAMAISGLWLLSLYCSGLDAFRRAAFALSGCAWMLKALPALKTFKSQGSWPSGVSTTLDSSVPSSRSDGPEACVPSQSSAYGAERSTLLMDPDSSA